MENKKYLDKVLDHLVRNIKIDHKKELVYTPPYSYNSYPSPFQYFLSNRSLLSPPSFRLYCKDQFGLTKEEMEYVWEEYKKILIDKIENGK